MKKNDWLLMAGILSYSYLFYEQSAGINFLVFTFILIGILCARNQYLLMRRSIWLPLIGSIVSAVCICLYGKGLAVFTNIVSLSILSIRFIGPENSLLLSLVHSVYSYVSAPIRMCIDAFRRLKTDGTQAGTERKSGLLFYLVPLVVFLVFFGLYRGSSSLFKNLTDQLSLDFISIDWLFFTFGGSILLYGFYYAIRQKGLLSLEEAWKDKITPSGVGTFTFMGRAVSILSEQKSGITMLVLLNLLILVVNVLDVQFLLLGSRIPEGMTHSELVHQGIDSLIASIIIAIVIILWYFRGEQNFAKNNTLRILAYVWIAQNVIMITFNAYKNGLYIEESSLTYKRIGVFVYLLLATIGLILTAVKLKQVKTTWFLLKSNAVAAYVALLMSCLVNWDLLITRFNIAQSEQKNTVLDAQYIALLSESVVPDLYEWLNKHKDPYDSTVKSMLSEKVREFMIDYELTDWRSWSMEQERIAMAIDTMFKNGTIDAFTFYDLETATAYHPFLRSVVVRTPRGESLRTGKLKSFTAVESLDLNGNGLNSIQGLPPFQHLKKLNLGNNNLYIFNPVWQYPTLEELDLSGNNLSKAPDLTPLVHLKSLTIRDNYIDDAGPLARLTSLEHLNLYNNRITDYAPLTKLTHLKTLTVVYMDGKNKAVLQKALPDLLILTPRN